MCFGFFIEWNHPFLFLHLLLMAFERTQLSLGIFAFAENNNFSNFQLRGNSLKPNVMWRRKCARCARLHFSFMFSIDAVHGFGCVALYLYLCVRVCEERMHLSDHVIHIQNRRSAALSQRMAIRTAAILIAAVRNVKLDATMHSTISSLLIAFNFTALGRVEMCVLERARALWMGECIAQ